ncbi:MAG: RNA polymerase sigma-70 factor (ECF subfamily) [Chlamydiales bacterium]|jgi:RNA polymerase sigma-70 factor (ECF subfamily)
MRSDLHTDDLALRDRILRGDRAQAEDLFRQQIDTLYEFVYYRVGKQTALAEDVVQDTIMVAFERLMDFDGRSSLHTWMCGIAKNKIRTQARKRRPVPIEDLLAESEGEIDAILTRIEQEPLPDEVIEARETRDLVGATLSSLPPHYREALTAKYIEGETVGQLSRRSGRNPKAVESTLHRARQAFSRIFQMLAARGSGPA